MASTSEAEVGGIFHNGETFVPLSINLNKRGFTQIPNPIKTDNSVDEGNVYATIRKKRCKAIDMRFYWIKVRVNKIMFCILETGMTKYGELLHKKSPTISQ